MNHRVGIANHQIQPTQKPGRLIKSLEVIGGILSMENTDKLAVLIDADNAQPSIIDGLLAEIANYGIASVKRI